MLAGTIVHDKKEFTQKSLGGGEEDTAAAARHIVCFPAYTYPLLNGKTNEFQFVVTFVRRKFHFHYLIERIGIHLDSEFCGIWFKQYRYHQDQNMRLTQMDLHRETFLKKKIRDLDENRRDGQRSQKD